MDRVDEAFRYIQRVHFLPEAAKELAHLDAPLPIGFGQTNSQPSTVYAMLEWLSPEPGNKILDVGSGFGWTTALLAYLVRPKGSVYAVEKVPELMRFGQENCRTLGVKNAHFFVASSHYGLPGHAPYDRILVSAAAENIPHELLDQLAVGGTMVVPVRHSIFVVDRMSSDDYETTEHPGFVFVPLVPIGISKRQ